MKRIAWILGLLAVATTAAAIAQPPAGGRGRGGPPGGAQDGDFRPPPPPVIMVLDVDRDHMLSAEEIKNASEALLTLDKNKDGKLTEDEFMGPPPSAANRRGPRDEDATPRRGRNANRGRSDDRGPPPDGPPGFGGPGDGPGPQGFGSPPGPPRPEQFVEHALQFDADKDGKLSADELKKMAEDLARHGPGGPGGPGDLGEDGPPRGDRRPRRPE
ncbi:MAG: hypothetical protein ABUL64_02845 [Singulisphaera sp.]